MKARPRTLEGAEKLLMRPAGSRARTVFPLDLLVCDLAQFSLSRGCGDAPVVTSGDELVSRSGRCQNCSARVRGGAAPASRSDEQNGAGIKRKRWRLVQKSCGSNRSFGIK